MSERLYLFSMMKYFLILTLLIGFSSPTFSQLDKVYGTWISYDDETGEAKSHVKLYKGKNGKLYGKVTRLLIRPQDTKCTKCKGSNYNQPVVGMIIVKGLEKDDDEWDDGTVLDPENGKTYSCKIWLDKSNNDNLYLRGYVGMFYRTQTWKRKS